VTAVGGSPGCRKVNFVSGWEGLCCHHKLFSLNEQITIGLNTTKASACLSVRPHETAPLPQDRFFMKLDSCGKAKQAQRVPGG
jgi:hypothetical protein